MRPSVKLVSVPVGRQFSMTVPPGLKKTRKRRGGAWSADARRGGIMTSSSGNPMATPPAPRSRVRRLMSQLPLFTASSSWRDRRAVEKRVGLGERDEELLDAAPRRGERALDRRAGAGVLGARAAAIAVGQPLADDARLDRVALGQSARELDRVGHRARDIGEHDLARAVDRLAVVDVAPAADGIVVLEREPDGIEQLVAGRAARVGGV